MTRILILFMFAAAAAAAQVATFSIVAYDAVNGDWGVTVASRYFSVGSVVPWAEAGVGAVATQANVNVGYGPRALELLRQGRAAKEVLDQLLAEDKFEGKDGRQVANNDGYIYINVDDNPQPFPELRRLLDINLGYLYQDKTFKLLRSGKTQDARDAAAQAAHYFPDRSDVHLSLGMLNYAVGDKKG